MPGQRRGARHSASAFSSWCTGASRSLDGEGAGSLRSSSRLQTPLFSSQCQPLEQFAQHPPSTALLTPAAATALPANTGAATAEGVLDTVHPGGRQATPHNINQCFSIPVGVPNSRRSFNRIAARVRVLHTATRSRSSREAGPQLNGISSSAWTRNPNAAPSGPSKTCAEFTRHCSCLHAVTRRAVVPR